MHLVTFSLVTILILHVDLRDEGKKQELLNDVSLTDSFTIDCPGSNLSLPTLLHFFCVEWKQRNSY